MVQWYSYHTGEQPITLVVVYWPCSAPSIQIHEIRELGIKKDRPTLCARREDVIDIRQEDGAEEVEEDSDLPSGYCTVVLNDEPVRGLLAKARNTLTVHLQIYRTRTKPMTASPFFNASTEQFVADWRSSHICLVVRDSRLRELDPILGVVYLKVRPSYFLWGTGMLSLSIAFRIIRDEQSSYSNLVITKGSRFRSHPRILLL